ncbi:HAD family hydrolase [Bacillus gaemokensis]|uniref:HAD family hydrolase n=1 Tax=Bacillus gaemokensis TaxID=574375 RepID=A0A073KBE1_9BACI|nr:HAD family hydrolase [Bacillus gaemokensis]KEK24584.1 HAD family hydrolase [Bacillus gaemokensis]KYG39472.1 HAD family hydrolase [Bacillus gaemokensis]
MLRTIILDFDGTLADTLPLCYYSFQNVFQEFDNQTLTESDILSMFGPSEVGIIHSNLISHNKEAATEKYYKWYTEKHHEYVDKNMEIANLLIDLKKRGFQLAIVTGKARRSLDISLETLELSTLFDCMITGDDVINPKPDPEGISHILKALNITKEQALFIGDSDADILAGKQAGVLTIGVQWLRNYQSPDFSIQPDYLIKSITDFVSLLDTELTTV